ncbi:MAG: glycine oxidase ThiO [Actinomycetales bacterium]|nr:glycine oxidase ThiO [Actinomycetales bacterium]
MPHDRPHVVIVGAGVIGLACAWRAERAGWRVSIVDPHPMHGASWAAAGMLAPVTESTPTEPGVLELGLRAAALWPGFAEQLCEDAGQPCGYNPAGTTVVGLDRDDATELRRLQDQLIAHSLPFTPLTTSQAREHEPALAPGLAAAMLVPGDTSVDNRALLGALSAVVDRRGITLVRERASAVSAESVRTATGEAIAADAVVVAAGIDTPALVPGLDIRPVKGQILRVLMTAATGRLLSGTVRATVHGRHVYLVPRSNGEIVIGATMEERGRDIAVTVGAVGDLLHDARLVVPGIDECELVETWAGLRPVSRDNLPVMRVIDDVLVCSGHGRNGILLAPLAAQTVQDLLNGRHAPASEVDA